MGYLPQAMANYLAPLGWGDGMKMSSSLLMT
jgi:glutamyl/glutaminyl-tRNA synthetase